MVDSSRKAPQSLSARLVAWAAWLPGRAEMVSGGAVQAAASLPLSLRRRITPIGRKVLEAGWALLAKDGAAPRIVLSSRHGEFARTFDLLTGLAESGEVSPAEFSLSVHHGLAGLLSIATGNTAGHSAVAGGNESFGYGFVEALASLAEGAPSVLLLHFDEALPDIYAPVADTAEEPVALALLLAPGDDIALETSPAAVSGNDPLALRFADLLTSDAPEAGGSGERLTWRWRRAA